MSEAMNIYETFNHLRYHHENKVVEFKKAENNFDFDDLGKYFLTQKMLLISVQIQFI